MRLKLFRNNLLAFFVKAFFHSIFVDFFWYTPGTLYFLLHFFLLFPFFVDVLEMNGFLQYISLRVRAFFVEILKMNGKK